MLLFCPCCSNILLIQQNLSTSLQEFYCQSCPYTSPIRTSYTSRTTLETRKHVDDVMGGEEAWKNVDSTESVCPKCEHRRAYFMQIQIRSADEPSSLFYRCCKCFYQWREG